MVWRDERLLVGRRVEGLLEGLFMGIADIASNKGLWWWRWRDGACLWVDVSKVKGVDGARLDRGGGVFWSTLR